MKKILIIAVLLTAGITCNSQNSYKQRVENAMVILTISGCEYVYYYDHGPALTHKGNCKFCTEREARKKMAEEAKKEPYLLEAAKVLQKKHGISLEAAKILLKSL